MALAGLQRAGNVPLSKQSETSVLTLQLISGSPGSWLVLCRVSALSSLFKALCSAGGHLLCPCPFAVKPQLE